MKPSNPGVYPLAILLALIILFPVAGADTSMSNESGQSITVNLTEEPVVTPVIVIDAPFNETVYSPAYNETQANLTGMNGTESGNNTNSLNLRSEGVLSEPARALEYTQLPGSDAPPDAKNYDHYVSFHMRANSLARNYAYDLINRGDTS